MSNRDWRISAEYRSLTGKWSQLICALPDEEMCRTWVKGARDMNRRRHRINRHINNEYRNIKIEKRRPGEAWTLVNRWER